MINQEEFFNSVIHFINFNNLDASIKLVAIYARQNGINNKDLLSFIKANIQTNQFDLFYVLSRVALQDTINEEEKITFLIIEDISSHYLKRPDLKNPYFDDVRQNIDLPIFYNKYAKLISEFKWYSDAEKYYKKSLKIDGNYAATHNDYALFLAKLGRYTEAKKEFKSAITAKSDFVMAYVNYGNLLTKLEEYKAAEEMYNKAISVNKNYASAYLYLGNLLMKLSRYGQAEEMYKKAIAVKPDFGLAYSYYGNLLSKMERYFEAEDHQLKAIRYQPQLAICHSNYGELLSKLKRNREAEVQFKEAIRVKSDFALAHNNYAVLLSSLNRSHEAEEQYKEAIASMPNFSLAYNNYAKLLTKRKQFSEAEVQIKEALEQNPDEPAYLFTYGNLLGEENFFEDACRYYQKAIKSPKFKDKLLLSEIHNNLGWIYLQLASCWKYPSKRILDKANHEFNLAIGNNQNNLEALHNLRKIKKMENDPLKSCFDKCQYILAIFFGILLFVPITLLFGGKISDNVFGYMFLFLVAGVGISLLYKKFTKFSIGVDGISFERSEGSAKFEEFDFLNDN